MTDESPDAIDMRILGSVYDVPAYVRRARNVEAALEHVLDRARVVRDEWLQMPRLRVGVLAALAGDWHALRPWLADDEQVTVLAHLHDELSPTLRLPTEPTRSGRALRHALREAVASIERFNARWAEYLGKIDVTLVNTLREGYNRYFLIEKICAVRNEAVARAGYAPLRPLDLAELRRLLPELAVPALESRL